MESESSTPAHEEAAEALEREVDNLEHHVEAVGERIDKVRHDWEAKRADSAVPGANPPDGREDDVEDTGE